MKNTPYEGTHIEPAVKAGRLDAEEREQLQQQMAEEARRKRQAAREERRRQKAERAAAARQAAPPQPPAAEKEDRPVKEAAAPRPPVTPKPPAPVKAPTAQPKPPAAAKEPKPLLRREQTVPPTPASSSKAQRSRGRAFLLAAVGTALLLAVLAFAFNDRSGAAARRQYMSEAAASYEAGDYDAALSSLRKAEAIQSDEASLLMMADCYEAQGKLDKTLELLRRMDPNNQSVSDRIADLERRRQAEAQAGYLSVAGQLLPPETRSLQLKDMDLGDEVLAELTQLHALDELDLSGNRITNLAPLAALGGLDELDLSDNQITDLSPLAELTELRSLKLDGNPLTQLDPLHALQQLKSLSLCGIALDADELRALRTALPDCAIHSDTARSEATDISLGGVTFRSDVAELDLQGLGVHDIRALTACRQLRFLKLNDNQISDLTPLMNLPALETLELRNNLITDLRPLMGLSKLRAVDAAGNRITDTAAVGAMAGLRSLDLSDNPLTDLSGLAKLTKLHSLGLRATGLYDGQLGYLEGMSLLSSLSLDDNPGLSNEAMGRLQSALPNCRISFTELVYAVNIGGVTLPSDAPNLDLSGRDISDVSGIDQMDRLETVNLSGNRIRNIYILQYSPSRDTIRILNLADNGLSDVTALSTLTAVESLDLRGNSISSVQPLLGLQSLRLLYLEGNPLSEQQLQTLREALPDCVISF